MITVTHAISLTQPWASLMAFGEKVVETRSWRTRYRGWIAIHASKGFPGECRDLCLEDPYKSALVRHGVKTLRDLPLGRVLAVVHVDACTPSDMLQIHFSAGGKGMPEHEEAFGNYAMGRWGFVTSGLHCLPEPIPMKGALGIWKMPAPIALP